MKPVEKRWWVSEGVLEDKPIFKHVLIAATRSKKKEKQQNNISTLTRDHVDRR